MYKQGYRLDYLRIGNDISFPKLNQTNDFKSEATSTYTNVGEHDYLYKNRLDHLRVGNDISFPKLNQTNDFKSEARGAYTNVGEHDESCKNRLDHLRVGNDMVVWLTRPTKQSLEMARILNFYNIKTHVEPLIDIKEIAFNVDISKYELLIFTSQNAIDIFARHIKNREIEIFVAGRTSFEIARQHGFSRIHIAENFGAKNIFEEIIKNYQNKKILYVTGIPHSLDFSTELMKYAISCDKVVVYESMKRKIFSEKLNFLLKNKAFGAILLLSAQTANCFVENVMPIVEHKISGKIIVLSQEIAHNLSMIDKEQIVILNNREKIINYLVKM